MSMVKKLHSAKLSAKRQIAEKKSKEHKAKMSLKHDALEHARKRRAKEAYRRLGKKEARANKNKDD